MHRTIITAICILVQSVAGQSGCGNVDSVNQFNADSFQGSWFVIESANLNSDLSNSPTCGRLVNSGINADGSVSVSYSQIVGRELTTYTGVSTAPAPPGPGILAVVLLPQGGAPLETAIVNVVAVDYSDYALLMLCRPVGDSIVETSWKLSRSRTELSSASVTAINQVVAGSSQLTGLTWETIDQTTETCGSSAVAATSSVLLLILAISGLVGRT